MRAQKDPVMGPLKNKVTEYIYVTVLEVGVCHWEAFYAIAVGGESLRAVSDTFHFWLQ